MSHYIPAPQALGALDWNQIAQSLIAGTQTLDPDLPEVIALAREIGELERRPGGLLDPRRPSTFRIGDLRQPLKAYLYYRKHPWVLYAIPLGLAGLIFALGRASR